jgi:hypothetical protein
MEKSSSVRKAFFSRRGVLHREESSEDGEQFFRRRGALQTEKSSFQTERSSSNGEGFF